MRTFRPRVKAQERRLPTRRSIDDFLSRQGYVRPLVRSLTFKRAVQLARRHGFAISRHESRIRSRMHGRHFKGALG